jgi:hypothetical protein
MKLLVEVGSSDGIRAYTAPSLWKVIHAESMGDLPEKKVRKRRRWYCEDGVVVVDGLNWLSKVFVMGRHSRPRRLEARTKRG